MKAWTEGWTDNRAKRLDGWPDEATDEGTAKGMDGLTIELIGRMDEKLVREMDGQIDEEVDGLIKCRKGRT